METELVLSLSKKAKADLARLSERKLGWFMSGRWTTVKPETFEAFVPEDTLSLVQLACFEIGSNNGVTGVHADIEFRSPGVLITIRFQHGRSDYIVGSGSDSVVACLQVLKKAYDFSSGWNVDDDQNVLGRSKSRDTLKPV
jgi:hypothetical protein